MRIAFVHGINNEDNPPEAIRSSWSSALLAGWEEAGVQGEMPELVVAHYGKELADAVEGKNSAVAMGEPGSNAGEALSLLEEYRREAGIGEEEYRSALKEEGLEPEVVEAGFPHNSWIITAARVLERIIPTKGKYLTKLGLPQASIYISNDGVRRWIDGIVRDQLFPGGRGPETIVISHSLGTLVSYNVLVDPDNPPEVEVPLFVTLGSPLTLESVRGCIPARSSFPRPPISRWLNGAHREDFVTLGKMLGAQHLGFDGVLSTADIINKTDDKHSIEAYLSSPVIAYEVARELGF
ncbi:MAG: hypothetical protein QNJ15_09765 [Erythrobacter sp.]|nr:hypothetical protein [Erythrobacter sp.]